LFHQTEAAVNRLVLALHGQTHHTMRPLGEKP
jgi:hypothetical protein